MSRPGRANVIHIRLAKRLVSHTLALVAALLRFFNSRRAVPSGREKSVVLLEPFGLGDVISHEPLARRLREGGWKVTICARPEWRVLFPGWAWVDSAAAWGRNAKAEKYGLDAYLGTCFQEFLRNLRTAARGGIGIDTRGDIRSVVLLYLSGCRRVITLSNYVGSNLRMLRCAAQRVEFSPERRRWENNLLCAVPLGVDGARTPPPSFPHWMSPVAASCRLGLVPVAPWEGKWWQPEKWAQLAGQLQARGWEVMGLCGPDQVELARRELGRTTDVVACPNVETWAGFLQEFALIVTVDSGPMHLADALGVPVVALFGQGLLPLWGPSGPAARVVTHQTDPDFRHCMPVEENTRLGREFMGRISVEEVLAAVEAAVGSQPGVAKALR